MAWRTSVAVAPRSRHCSWACLLSRTGFILFSSAPSVAVPGRRTARPEVLALYYTVAGLDTHPRGSVATAPQAYEEPVNGKAVHHIAVPMILKGVVVACHDGTPVSLACRPGDSCVSRR